LKIDSDETVDQALDRKKNRIENRRPLFENPLKVRANRFDEKRHNNNK
jgi:putative ubiquitin-RnfH superfamily antitoxin RatB of RatAB toxin-antitoxin module